MDDDAHGVLTRWRILIGAVVLLAIVTSLSAVVGFVGARDDMRFDWELAAIFGTALGTTLLALATGALAYSTSGDVRATWRLARLARDDQLAREKPVVVLTGYGWKDLQGEGEGCIRIDLMNIGMGPALDIVIEARYPEAPITGHWLILRLRSRLDLDWSASYCRVSEHGSVCPSASPDHDPDWPPSACVEIRGTFTGRGRSQRYSLDGDEVPDTERFVWTDPSRRGIIMVSLPQEDT